MRELKRLGRWGKPVAITEFGTCTYKGAPRRGGLGWDVIDYEHQPPRIAHDLDLASYAIVKPIWKTRDRPTAGWHWEPKEAFRAVARHYARAKPVEAVDFRDRRLSS